MDNKPKDIEQENTPAKRNKSYQAFNLFIQGLEDGQLNQDATEALQLIAQELNDHIRNTGKSKAKGSLSLKIDFTLDRGVFEIDSKLTTKLPDAPRGKSVMWTDGDSNFTPQNPRQISMFD